MSSEDKPSNSSQPTPTSSRLSLPSRKSSFLTILKAQIAVLLSTLSENTYAKSVGEIKSVGRGGAVWKPLDVRSAKNILTN